MTISSLCHWHLPMLRIFNVSLRRFCLTAMKSIAGTMCAGTYYLSSKISSNFQGRLMLRWVIGTYVFCFLLNDYVSYEVCLEKLLLRLPLLLSHSCSVRWPRLTFHVLIALLVRLVSTHSSAFAGFNPHKKPPPSLLKLCQHLPMHLRCFRHLHLESVRMMSCYVWEFVVISIDFHRSSSFYHRWS